MTLKKHLIWIVPLLIFDIVALTLYLRRRPAAPDRPPAAEFKGETDIADMPSEPKRYILPESQLRDLTWPTAQTALLDPEAEGVFQTTASGRPESALYGSTRTRRQGNHILPSFHEGIDIAAMRRDRRGRPLDEIYAIAPGRVGYINHIIGNSNYGKYIVLTHDDPAGEIYSLYAHLADIADGLRAGQSVSAGQTLGIMGNTPAGIIPMARAHLHLEIGIILNDRFRNWFRSKKLKLDHGRFHGWNLLGIDPLAVFEAHRETDNFNMLRHLAAIPPAFEIVLKSGKLPDYFRRYPLLWNGQPFNPPALAVICSESGVPLAGRNAEPHEIEALGRADWLVVNVDEDVLGRNGARIILRRSGQWQLGRNGERWREMLMH